MGNLCRSSAKSVASDGLSTSTPANAAPAAGPSASSHAAPVAKPEVISNAEAAAKVDASSNLAAAESDANVTAPLLAQADVSSNANVSAKVSENLLRTMLAAKGMSNNVAAAAESHAKDPAPVAKSAAVIAKPDANDPAPLVAEVDAAIGAAVDAEPNAGDDDGSVASAVREVLPLFARGSEDLRVLNLAVDESAADVETEPAFSLSCPKLAAWSPDGDFLAVADPVKGLMIIDSTESAEFACHILSPALTAVQHLQWSPKGTYLVVQSPFKGDNEDPNVQTWKRADGGSKCTCDATFQNPKVERSVAVLQWTADEHFCCRSLPDGTLQLLDGADLSKPPLVAMLPWEKSVQAFEFAPLCDSDSGSDRVLCAFTADSRDAMQRVVAPAEVAIFKLSNQDASIARTVPVKFGQQADLKWSPTGTALLANCQTDTDDSGQSYYGASKLVVISELKKYMLDLTEAKDSVVQAVDWCPTKDQFVLIQGFQPAKVTCWTWDPQKVICTMTAVLEEKAHRNTIRWNSFGSMVCVAGFGNLAGQMAFFGQTSKGLTQISSCEASCSVSAEWAPDGRHFMTATLAPRMRVDNGFSIWYALNGTKVVDHALDPLYEVQWKPEPPNKARFVDVSSAEIEHALTGASTSSKGAQKKQAYRPPTGRAGVGGDNRVAMMMRGEIASAEETADNVRKMLTEMSQKKDPITGAAEGNGSKVARQGGGSDPVDEKKTSGSRQTGPMHGAKAPCPTTGWEYTDPKGKKQGPFTLEQMTKWFEMGAFKPSLPLRCDPMDRFMPLRELFPHPMVPFQSYPKRPSSGLAAQLRNRNSD